MTNTKVQAYVNAVESSLDKIVETVTDLSEETIRWKPSDEEWSILQVVSHLNEATPFWLGELDTILSAPSSEWGRGLQHPGRLAAVENPAALNVNDEIETLKNLKHDVAERLGQVKDEQLSDDNPHRNFAKFGNKPVSFMIEHFIVEHTEGHYNQIKRNLNKLSEVNA